MHRYKSAECKEIPKILTAAGFAQSWMGWTTEEDVLYERRREGNTNTSCRRVGQYIVAFGVERPGASSFWA